jgi:tetratricopeptide (TPR) repeat protein
MDAEEVVDLLSRLHDKSLVVLDEATGRFRLMAMVRGYAEERLEEQGEAEEMRQRHFEWASALASEAAPHFEGPEMQVWLDRIETEHGNVRAGLTNAPAPESRLQLAIDVHRFWFIRGYLTEGRDWLEGALHDGGGENPARRAKALNCAGILAWRKGDLRAAHKHFVESLDIRKQLGDINGVAVTLNNLGLIADDEGDHTAANGYYRQSLPLCRELGDSQKVGLALLNIGSNLLEQGKNDEAEAAFEECLINAREAGDLLTVSSAWQNLAEVAFQRNDLSLAATLAQDALRTVFQLGDSVETMQILMLIGCIEIQCGSPEMGLQYLATADAFRHAENIRLRPHEELSKEQAIQIARAVLHDGEYAKSWESGRSQPLEAAAQQVLDNRLFH